MNSLSWTDCVVPDWPAPPNIGALATARPGGVSSGVYESLNIGKSVGDDPEAVAENRARIARLIGHQPRWIGLVHGKDVVDIDTIADDAVVRADAAVSRTPGRVCTVTMADCLAVLFTNREGSVVAAAHAGWRGLAAGVLESTVKGMQVKPDGLMAWLAPAIGPTAFEVGRDVREAFIHAADHDDLHAVKAAFAPVTHERMEQVGKWHADLFVLARIRLTRAGLPATMIFGGEHCTYSNPARFFSHRRATHEGLTTGRMAALIWRES